MTSRLGVLASVFRNPALRRVAGAFLAFSIGEWATWVAMVVYAYGRGGAAEAGLIVFVQLVPSVIVAPAAGTLGDRFPRARVLIASYVIQGVTMAAVAIALWLDLPAPVIYVLATLTATAVTMTRPVQAAFLPDVAETPDQLTAANVAAGTIEGAGTLLGPAIAGLVTAAGGPALVFAVTSAGMLLASLAVLPLGRARTGVVPAPVGTFPEPVTRVLAAGVTEIGSDVRLRALAALLACSFLLLGALDIFYAVLAIDMLNLGDSGVGYLGAATGFGMLAGGVLAVSLVGRTRLGGPIVAAAVVFGTALALVGFAPAVLVAGLLVVAGLGSQFVYIGVQTMTQRIANDAVLSRVFGVYEALMQGSTAVGALAVPVLIAAAGTNGAFVLAGLILPLVALLAGRALLVADRTAVVPLEELRLLRGIPMFAPLSAPVLESLAGRMRVERFPDGAEIVRQGDPGDRYFVIERGTVRVEIDGRPVHDQGPGEGFGEIALLRDVPRTATVRAVGPVEVFSLAREPFLAALTGQPASRTAAEAVVRERLANRG
jgi:MFS family permease